MLRWNGGQSWENEKRKETDPKSGIEKERGTEVRRSPPEGGNGASSVAPPEDREESASWPLLAAVLGLVPHLLGKSNEERIRGWEQVSTLGFGAPLPPSQYSAVSPVSPRNPASGWGPAASIVPGARSTAGGCSSGWSAADPANNGDDFTGKINAWSSYAGRCVQVNYFFFHNDSAFSFLL